MILGDAQELTHLSNDSGFKLPALIRVELLWWRKVEEELISKAFWPLWWPHGSVLGMPTA